MIGIAAKQVLQSFQAVKAYADDLVVLQVLMTTGSRVLQDVVQVRQDTPIFESRS